MNGGRTNRRCRRGFSLIEVLAVVVILGIVGGVSSSLTLTNVASFTDSSARIQLHGEASVTLDRLVREFREIDPDPEAGPPHPDISQAERTVLRWSGTHMMRLAGESLLLSTDGVHEDVLCEGVSELAMDFLDESNRSLLMAGAVPDGDLALIQRIAIRLSVTRQGITETLTTRVFIRAAMTGETP